MPRVRFFPFYNGAFFDSVDGLVRKGPHLPTRFPHDGSGGGNRAYARNGAFVCGADQAPSTAIQALMESAPHEEPKQSSEERLAHDETVADAVDALSPRERHVIEALFWRRLTLRQLAAELSLSKTQCARVRDASLAKLRHLLSVRDLSGWWPQDEDAEAALAYDEGDPHDPSGGAPLPESEDL